MMRQYAALKRENPDALLLFRCGDFYETYCEDAEEVGRLLGLVVTRKGAGADGDVAMAGVPFHAIDSYLARLVKLGRRVAIAEQTEDPKLAKGLVRREIVRIVTPGTVTEDTILQDSANNYLVALHRATDGTWGVALADVSTGFFALTEVAPDDAQGRLLAELASLDVREILLAADAEAAILQPLLVERAIAITRRNPDDFRHAFARGLLLEHFAVQSLEGFGAEHLEAGVRAAGALLQYLRETQKSAVRHLSRLRVHHGRQGMVLDAVTQRSLELVANLHGGGREATLLSVIDRTRTPMGARLLRAWVLQPLGEREAIERRLEAVADLVAAGPRRAALADALKGVRDLERIVGRASVGTASPRDLGALRAGLQRLPDLQAALGASAASHLRDLAARLDLLGNLRATLEHALVDEPPARATDGGLIRPGHAPALDDIRAVARDSKTWIAQFRAREAARTGIDKLKIGYNKVFGYYIELTHAQVRQLAGGEPPADYVRKQTLANGERYITPELKEKEDIILHAEERMLALEQQLFEELRAVVAAHAPAILADAEIVAQADCLLSLAEVAVAGRYVRPDIADDGPLEIHDGRHPVLEALQTDPPFVANDTLLAPDACQIALITGPNMAGKSTYIRQVALIALLAHVGSFVPARSARIPLLDRIFTRVGAMDHLARGQSTFLVEMTETANILHHATARSLVILDEIGRGTSTYDGLSIAWAVCEFLHNTPGRTPLTLFATHYHELTNLEGPLARLRNFHVAVLEEKQRIVFLFKLIPGATDRSYGVHAAEFAGVPGEVVARARVILSGLERGEAVAPQSADALPAPRARKRATVLPQAEPWHDRQLSLFDTPHPALERLRLLDPNRLTPLEALAVLAELKRLAEEK
jgi:DNA mismatch repair protein MutS